VKTVTQISRLNIKGSKQNNFKSEFGEIGLFEMDTDDKPITVKGKESPYELPDVLGYIQKGHPLEIIVSGNNLNGNSIIQLFNSLLEHRYQLNHYKYDIDHNKILDGEQYAGKSLILRLMSNK